MSQLSRRDFLQATTITAATTALASGLLVPQAAAKGRSARVPAQMQGGIRIGVIGCGGRGTGAAQNALEASPDTTIVAMGDMFKDRTHSAREELSKLDANRASRVAVTDDTVFHGFDAYKKVLEAGVDMVILATPPGFRPQHFAAAVEAGKHVFMEKPVAVDPAGVRLVIDAAKRAKENKLSVVSGTQRRHEQCYMEAKKRIDDGAIGKVLSASVYWNQGGLWNNGRDAAWSDMEWQIRNWLYFTWLSGDHICEQHVHNLDVAHWYMDQVPTSCGGMGGRQVRTSPEYGHVFDHFAIEYAYPDGRTVSSYCRQIDGCASRVEELIYGSEGYAKLSSGHAEIFGKRPWKWQGDQLNPYVQEHKDLVASLTGAGTYVNEGERIARSTMMAIMGRMSAYTGKNVPWEMAMGSKLDLTPPTMELGSLPVPEVAIPGTTPLV